MNNLVIVESPAKGRTLEKFLGSGYQVIASMGHVRDLPKSELGIDVSHNFLPQYIIPRAKRKQVNQLKKLAIEAKMLWLATDPDREGEAIAWHIGQIVGIQKSDVRRVVFHEITEEAVKQAFTKPRDLDMQLIDAQQARRVLDRLVGYKLSPLLWMKVKRGLSAGRVQSVTLRLIVEREREISAFKPEEYWTIEAELESSSKNQESKFLAALIKKDSKKLVIKNEKETKEHALNLERAIYQVEKIAKKQVKKYPSPPFTTSTMQQAAVNKLMFTSKKTMKLAQDLYERGLITYMRTDSVNLSSTAFSSARSYIGKEYGKNYLPPTPRIFKTKSKNAQEAHEAIRPTNMQAKISLTKDHEKLYDLIWKRFVACQMSEALVDQTSVDIKADDYILRANGSVIKFDGWLKLYQVSSIKYKGEDNETEKILPDLSEGEILKLIKILSSQHFTEPPARFTESSLIKTLEELGIGRPSTYAPIISTIKERFYVEVEERKFIPTALGFAVCDFIVKYFPEIVDFKFTAKMEDELDEIARGERQWVPVISEFYTPFEKKLESVGENAEKVKVAVEFAGRNCPKCGKQLLVRIGRFGKFLACSGFPECKYTESLEEKLSMPCPLDGGEIVVRHTKKRRVFYGCKNWPTCKFASWTKPK